MVEPTQTEVDKQHQKAIQAVYVKSEIPDESKAMKVKGYDFEKGVDYEQVFKSYISTGFQATSLG
jgi:deoxyhypusine synthase